MIDHLNKAVYIAAPRTGSQAISQHLGIPAGNTLTQLRNRLGVVKWKEYKIVGVVRDPIKRFLSVWRYYYTLGCLDMVMPPEFYRLIREEFQTEYPTPDKLVDYFWSAYRRPLLHPFLQPLDEAFRGQVTGELEITHLLYPEGMTDISIVNSLTAVKGIHKLAPEIGEETEGILKAIYANDVTRWNTPDFPTVRFVGKNLVVNP